MKEDHKPNCRLDGCEDGLLKPELCRGCGWDKVEEARRRLLPLTRCEDGLYRIIVTTPAAAHMTRTASGRTQFDTTGKARSAEDSSDREIHTSLRPSK